MNQIIPISDLQMHAKKYVDQVKKTKEPVLVTQRGRAAAILVDPEIYEGHKAVKDEMTYSDWKARLERARKEAGSGISIESYLKRRTRKKAA